MQKLNFFKSYFSTIASKISEVDTDLLFKGIQIILDTNTKGGKVIFVGNGGSAAMASHLSVDLTKAASIRAINFNEADLLTCFANDYGYEHWVAKALEAYADENDTVVFISSSGKSPNIINGVSQARLMNLKIITLSGFNSDNPLSKLGDINFWCESIQYNVVEMTHHVWLLAMVDYIINCRND